MSMTAGGTPYKKKQQKNEKRKNAREQRAGDNTCKKMSDSSGTVGESPFEMAQCKSSTLTVDHYKTNDEVVYVQRSARTLVPYV